MGTITGTTIIDSVARSLQDETHVKWLRTELLSYLNDGQREIVLVKPDAFVKSENLQLVAGTAQTIPLAANVFMRVLRNKGVAGTVAGRAPRYVPIQIMDEQQPDWHSSTASGVALHYTFDGKDPKRFYVWPPQPAVSPHFVEISYSGTPTDLAVEANTLVLDDLYKSLLIQYMMFRAYSKDAEYAREDTAADRAYKTFGMLIGLKDKAEDEEKAAR